MIRVCLSRISDPIPGFVPSRIPDGVCIKTLDPGSETLVIKLTELFFFSRHGGKRLVRLYRTGHHLHGALRHRVRVQAERQHARRHHPADAGQSHREHDIKKYSLFYTLASIN